MKQENFVKGTGLAKNENTFSQRPYNQIIHIAMLWTTYLYMLALSSYTFSFGEGAEWSEETEPQPSISDLLREFREQNEYNPWNTPAQSAIPEGFYEVEGYGDMLFQSFFDYLEGIELKPENMHEVIETVQDKYSISLLHRVIQENTAQRTKAITLMILMDKRGLSEDDTQRGKTLSWEEFLDVYPQSERLAFLTRHGMTDDSCKLWAQGEFYFYFAWVYNRNLSENFDVFTVMPEHVQSFTMEWNEYVRDAERKWFYSQTGEEADISQWSKFEISSFVSNKVAQWQDQWNEDPTVPQTLTLEPLSAETPEPQTFSAPEVPLQIPENQEDIPVQHVVALRERNRLLSWDIHSVVSAYREKYPGTSESENILSSGTLAFYEQDSQWSKALADMRTRVPDIDTKPLAFVGDFDNEELLIIAHGQAVVVKSLMWASRPPHNSFRTSTQMAVSDQKHGDTSLAWSATVVGVAFYFGDEYHVHGVDQGRININGETLGCTTTEADLLRDIALNLVEQGYAREDTRYGTYRRTGRKNTHGWKSLTGNTTRYLINTSIPHLLF